MPVPPIRKFLSLADVSAGTITNTTPWLVFNSATGKIEGHAAPAGGGGGTTVVAGSGANQTLRWDTGTTSYLPAANQTNDGNAVNIFAQSASTSALTVTAAVGQGAGQPVFALNNSVGQQMFAVTPRYSAEPQILVNGQVFMSAESGHWLFQGRTCVFASGILLNDNISLYPDGAAGTGVVSLDTRVAGSGNNIGPIVFGDRASNLTNSSPTAHKWIELACDSQARPGTLQVGSILSAAPDDALLLGGQMATWFDSTVPALKIRVRALNGSLYNGSIALTIDNSGGQIFGGGN